MFELAQGLLDFAGEFVPAGDHQLPPCMAESQQLLPSGEQRLLVVLRSRVVGLRPIVVELRQRCGYFTFGLQQQALRITGQLASGEQINGGEADQLFQARPQVFRQHTRQLGGALLQLGECLLRLAVAQRVAAGEIALDVFCGVVLKLLRQAQVTRHEQVGALHGTLGPPERDPECQADRDEQQGIESGERLQAHPCLAGQIRSPARYGSLMSFALQPARLSRWRCQQPG